MQVSEVTDSSGLVTTWFGVPWASSFDGFRVLSSRLQLTSVLNAGGEGVTPLAERDAPIRDRTIRIGLERLLEDLLRLLVPE